MAVARATLRVERELWAQGYCAIAGLDEVGRGPLAGPVVAGAIILPRRLHGAWTEFVRDSKLLAPSQRRAVAAGLRESAVAIGIGAADVAEIDRLNILRATRLAMRRALAALSLAPDFLLIDALHLPDVSQPQRGIVHGDRLCRSIAAASIVAKVHRDALMDDLDRQYPGYGLAQHKGYATVEHLASLRRLGPSPIHRLSFAPVRDLAQLSFGGDGWPGTLASPPVDAGSPLPAARVLGGDE